MQVITFQNSNGDILECDELKYSLLSVEGLSCPTAELTYTEIAGHDGGIFNSKRLSKRNLVATIKIHNPAQTNRINLYKFFQSGAEIRVNYKSSVYDCYITGRVESFEPDIFALDEQVVISIICEDPYWEATETTVVALSNALGLFHFPFYKDIDDNTTIVFGELTTDFSGYIVSNNGIEVGMLISIVAVNDGISDIQITNKTTGEELNLNYTMSAGERITINTRTGEKSITLKSSDGTETNLINKMDKDSSFIQLATGENEIVISCSSVSGIEAQIEVLQLYQGV